MLRRNKQTPTGFKTGNDDALSDNILANKIYDFEKKRITTKRASCKTAFLVNQSKRKREMIPLAKISFHNLACVTLNKVRTEMNDNF